MALTNFLRVAFTVAALGSALAAPARAEVSQVRISKGFGILYLPLIVMNPPRHQAARWDDVRCSIKETNDSTMMSVRVPTFEV